MFLALGTGVEGLGLGSLWGVAKQGEMCAFYIVQPLLVAATM